VAWLHRGDGAAQYCADAKILTIYEGTTAIQANDPWGARRCATAADGQGARANESRARKPDSPSKGAPRARLAGRLKAARVAFRRGGGVRRHPVPGPIRTAVFAGSVPYLLLGGNLVAGWQMARALLLAEQRLAGGGRRPSSCVPRSSRRGF